MPAILYFFKWETYLIESEEVADRGRHRLVVGELVLEVGDEHPELSTPVTEVVQF